MIVLLLISDGRRDYLLETVPSALAMLQGLIVRRVMYDDSGDEQHHDWIRTQFPTFEHVTHPHGRQGFGGAIRTAWRHLGLGPERFVFHLEQDFTFNRLVDLAAMVTVLDEQPDLVQLALRRQPWNDHERLAGGIIEQHPDAYTDCSDEHGNQWLEHRLFFTTNPSLYRRSLCLTSWPEGGDSEGHFTHQLLRAEPDVRFGFWGARDSGEWITHIGQERNGTGY